MGGGSPLEGGKALGLSASLWGEQVISYVGSGDRANQGRIPGVSRHPSRGIPRIQALTLSGTRTRCTAPANSTARTPHAPTATGSTR